MGEGPLDRTGPVAERGLSMGKIPVAVFRNETSSGAEGIMQALGKMAGIDARLIEDLALATLSGYTVLVVPATRYFHAETEALSTGQKEDLYGNLPRFVGDGGGVMLIRCGVGFRHDTIRPVFPGIVKGVARSEYRFIEAAEDGNPVFAELGRFRTSYYDHIVLEPGPEGEAVLSDEGGEPVVVAGKYGRGRVLATGLVVGTRQKEEQDTPEPVAGPEGGELQILTDAVRWLSENANRIQAIKAALDRKKHPYLLIDSAGITKLKEKIVAAGWARDYYQEKIKDKADETMREDVFFPEIASSTSCLRACRECGTSIIFDRRKPHEHLCPECGRVYKGEQWDMVWREMMHHELEDCAIACALAYAIEDDTKYAERVKEILLGYADRYGQYPPPPKIMNSRIFQGRIYEVGWIVKLAWSYDLIYSSGVLSEADKTHIETDLLRASAECICLKREPWGSRNNWWVRFTMATGFIGFCVKDMDYVEFGLRCFDTMMEERIQQDGMWPETIGYHFYAWDSMSYFTEAAANFGVNLYENPVYKKMYSIPMKLIAPDHTFVADGDVRPGRGLSSYRHFYDVLSHRYEDESIRWVLRQAYSVEKEKREDVLSFIFSPDCIKEGKAPGFESLQTDTLTRLCTGKAGDQIVVWVDCGVRGGHQHPDRLNLILWANNRFLAPDIGTCDYRIPQYKSWITTGLAHNLVVIDEGRGNRSEGRTDFLGITAPVKIIDASHPGSRTRLYVKQRRIVILCDSYLVDVYQVEDIEGEEHQYDWVYHNYGELRVDLPLALQEAPLGPENGYQCVTDITRAKSDGQWEATWCQGNRSKLRLTMFGERGTEIIAGTGIGNPVTERIPLVIARRKAARTAYISVLEPFRQSPAVKRIVGLSAGGLQGIRVEREEGTDYFLVSSSRDRVNFKEISIRGELGAISRGKDNRIRYMYLIKGRELAGGACSVRTDTRSTIYLDCSDPEVYLVENQGPARCQIELQGDFGKEPRIYESDSRGRRIQEIKAVLRESSLEFAAKATSRYRITKTKGNP